jgi:hypothetical protein
MVPGEPMPVRVALVLEGESQVPDWQWRLVDKLQQDPRIKLVAVLDAPPPPQRERPPAIAAAILAVDRALFARSRPYPRLHVVRRVRALPKGLPDHPAERGCDLILNLAPTALPAPALAGVRHGEWRLSTGAARAGRLDWSGFAAASSGVPASTVEITARYADRPAPQVVAAARYSTKVSAARTGAFAQEKCAILVLRSILELAPGIEQIRACEGKAAEAAPHGEPAPAPDLPGVGDTLRYALRLSGALVLRGREAARTRFGRNPEYWQLALGAGSIDCFEPGDAVDLPRLEATMADPFLFSHQGAQYIFYEAHPGGNGPARIDVARLEGDDLVELGTALRRPYHLSFPFVFRDGERIFMLPETQQSNRLEVWRCVEFPMRWGLHATALEGRFPADSVLFRHGQAWWLASNLSDHHAFQEHSSELYLFQVDGPELRQIEPHRLNPVVIGSGTARNAGNIVACNGRLYRPSQINDRGVYGYGLNIMEIEALDLHTYRERLLRRIEPAFRPGLLRVHHLSVDAGRFVIDIGKAA